MTGFNIHIESNWHLDVTDVWPDGDAPEHPTPEDVKNVMESQGTRFSVLRCWELLSDLAVDVDGVPVWDVVR